jgi:hypothetical protein
VRGECCELCVGMRGTLYEQAARCVSCEVRRIARYDSVNARVR